MEVMELNGIEALYAWNSNSVTAVHVNIKYGSLCLSQLLIWTWKLWNSDDDFICLEL